MVGVPNEVVTDVEVEVAIVVEIGKRRGGRPVALATKASGIGDVFKGPVAPVAIER